MEQKIYKINEIRAMLRPVFEAAPVYRAILFGSYAKGSQTDKSDIDIVIDSQGELLNMDFYGVLEDITNQLGKRVDLFEITELKKQRRHAICSGEGGNCLIWPPSRIILQKIRTYIDDVSQYIDGFSFEVFMADKKTLSACAFSVSQIGELAKEISGDTQEKHVNIPWKSIRGMRNKIVHDYENIDLAVLWGTITKSLPELAKQIDGVLYQAVDEINVLNNENNGKCER